jgi:putative ABC transport system permease protein
MTPGKISPPHLAQRFLTKFLRDDLVEEVRGDLEEQFYSDSYKKSLFKAKVNYWYQVFNYIRPFALRKSMSTNINSYNMLRSYFKIGWRSLTKQRMYSTIKVGGFSLGIASCLLIALFINDELSYDLRYSDGDRIFRVVQAYNYMGESGKDVWFQAPFAKALKDDYPEIAKAGRYNSSALFGAGSKEIRRSDKIENTYEEGFVYFDQELLDILHLPMIYGNPAKALSEPHTIVITKRKADKYFPHEDPVGRALILNNDEKNPFKIGGVIEDFPTTSHLQYDFLMTMTGVQFWDNEQSDWGATNYPTYILLKPGADPKQLAKKMQGVVEKYLFPFWIKEGVPNAKAMSTAGWFELQPVKDIHLRSEGISDPVSHGDIRFVWLFGAVAAFILLIAMINFINLSTAKSANRAKEVGLRKTVGSLRVNIINQFLTESFLYSVFSFVIGVFLAWLLLPYFNLLSAKSIEFPWNQWQLFPVLMVSSLVVGILAGLYPAFYLSSFNPASVLKGNVSRGSKSSTMRSSLVVFQFTTSVVLIIATFIIYRQVEYILNKKVGFDKDQVILIQGTSTLDKKIKTFKDELLQLSQVKSVTVSDYLPIRGTKRNGNGFWNEGKDNVDHSVGSQIWRVDYDYIKTLGMKIVDGRNFSENMASDSSGIIINQTMAKKLGLVDPVGKRIQNNRVWNVVGVVEDFHFESLRDQIGPLCFVLGNNSNIVSVKVNTASMTSVIQSIDGIWKKFSPHQPIRFTFLDESFAGMYDDVQRMGRIFISAACLAVIVACLGLFALSAFMVEQRSKEISIRLVLGASLNTIFNMLTFNFLKLVAISIAVAVPIAWYVMHNWLQNFTYRTEITWDVFVIAGSLSLLIALLTISYQSIRAAFVNPVENLKTE